MDTMLDSYRTALLAKNEAGQMVDSAGPIVLGHAAGDLAGAPRLAHHHLRQGLVDHSDAAPPDGRRAILRAAGRDLASATTTRRSPPRSSALLAAEYLPPKSDDPKLESFFDQWVYGTGIPVAQDELECEGRGAKREADRHGDAIRRGRGFHGRGAGRDYDRQGADDDAVGAVGRCSGDVHGAR